jgi:hypothetical protein
VRLDPRAKRHSHFAEPSLPPEAAFATRAYTSLGLPSLAGGRLLRAMLWPAGREGSAGQASSSSRPVTARAAAVFWHGRGMQQSGQKQSDA